MITTEQLKKYSYFERLSDSFLAEIQQRLETVIVPAGAEIIKQNTPAKDIYFIKEGEVEITKRTRHGQEAKITTLKAGSSFGEMALLTCSPRNNTVKSLSEVQLLCLSRKDFEEIIMLDSSLKSLIENNICAYKDYNQIKTFQPLALLAPEKTPALMERFTEKKFRQGEKIIAEGEPGDHYYIIKEGRASVISKGEEIARIKVGDGFGEEAIMRDKSRNATITALTDMTVFSLDKADFNTLLEASFLEFSFSDEIPEEDMARYIFIDARIPPEYEEEHIAGAINIPLEELRSKFCEMDKNQEYLTYCTFDSRGKAAAFLMSTMGFRARHLRGGISGWEGPLMNAHDGIHYPEGVSA